MLRRLLIPVMLLGVIFFYNTRIFAIEEKGPERNFEMDSGLNLTKEQSERLYKIRQKYFSDMERLRHEIFQKRIELRNLYFDSKVNETAIFNKQKELSELRQKLEDMKTEMMIEERKILTPEQLEMLNKYPFEKRYERMGPGRGKFKRGIGPHQF